MENVVAVPGSSGDRRVAAANSRKVLMGYWVFTLLVSLPQVRAGVADILHAPPLFAVLLHLGYPPYFGPSWCLESSLRRGAARPSLSAGKGVGVRRLVLRLHGCDGIPLGRWAMARAG